MVALTTCSHSRSTCIGIRCKDGVVLGLEKLLPSKLLVRGSNKRLASVDRHVGMVRPRAVHLLTATADRARLFCRPPPVSSLTAVPS